MNRENLMYTKKQYTKELVSNIRYKIYEIYIELFNKINHKYKFRKFQIELKNIVNWNNIVINNKVEYILYNTKNNYMQELLEMILKIEISIFTIVNNIELNKNEIYIPTFTDFCHKTLIECARHFFVNPFLFENNIESKKNKKI